MTATDHLNMIDAAMKQMSAEGHFNDLEVSIAAGNVEHALSRLREEIKKAVD